MNSTTKRRLTPSEIDNVVSKAFGTTPSNVQEFLGGSMNSAYRIEMQGREPVVLKVGSAREARLLTYEQDALRTEVSFYNLAAGALPLPEMLFADLDRRLIDSDYMFISLMKGKCWAEVAADIDQDQSDRLTRHLGALAGSLHNIKGTHFGYTQPGTPCGLTWEDAFVAMCDAVLADTIKWKVALPITQDAIRAAVLACTWSLREVEKASLLHFDLWRSNIFLTDQHSGHGWALEGIIDCERSFWGDPLAELVSVYPMQDPIDPLFLEGYAETSEQGIDLTPSAHCRLALYQIYLALVWVAESVPHGYLEGPAAESVPMKRFYAGIGNRIADLVATCRTFA